MSCVSVWGWGNALMCVVLRDDNGVAKAAEEE